MDFAQMITSATRNSGLSCPKCTSLSYRRHGKHLGIQRYCCKICGKTFKETVNTPLHWIHNKSLIPRYIQSMTDQFSIRAAAKELDISASTAFRWRHKLLSSLIAKRPAFSGSPTGIAQILTPHSFKGKRTVPETKLPCCSTIIITDGSGRVSLNHLRQKNRPLETSKWLESAVPVQSFLASPPISWINNAARATGRKMILYSAEKKRLLSNTRKTILQIHDWMARFRGVASKYLHQYWNWFCAEQTANAGSFIQDCLGARQIQHYRRILIE